MNSLPLASMLDWVHALGWTLLHFVWQGAAIGVAYAIVRAVSDTSRAQVRYASGLAALSLMALAPMVTLWQLAPVGAAGMAGLASDGAAPVAAIAGAADAAASATGLEPWLPWLVGAWLAGVCLASLRACRQYWRLRELVRREAEPLREWEPLLRELAQRFSVSRMPCVGTATSSISAPSSASPRSEVACSESAKRKPGRKVAFSRFSRMSAASSGRRPQRFT